MLQTTKEIQVINKIRKIKIKMHVVIQEKEKLSAERQVIELEQKERG